MDIDTYLDGIIAQIQRVKRDATLAVAQEIFQKVVNQTRIDSGQAALNWHIEAYENEPQFLPQEMLWGYGKVQPTTPAGYKWSKSDNSEAVFIYQFEYMLNQISLAPDKIAGVVIYNPIEPGFEDFAPGSDQFYAKIAFEKLDIAAITAEALQTVEAGYNR